MRVGTWLFLAVCIPFSTVAHAGAGVWTSGGPYGGDILSLAINPSNPATLYAGTFGGGVFKSTDSGGTWASANGGLTMTFVFAVAVDPASPATLYAGGTIGDVFKSTDAGASWAAANKGLQYRSIVALAIDPVTPSTLYAGSDTDGVFKSTDSGGTWFDANTGLGHLDVYALAINPATPSTLYAATYGGGVFKSIDSGRTWAATSLTTKLVYAIAINPAAPSTLYAGSFGDGVFKSTDSGSTWAAVLPGVAVLALAVDPVNPTTLYAGGGGVERSTDSGGTWSSSDTVLRNNLQTLAVNPINPATLYAGTQDGVFKSTDSGRTWAAASMKLTNIEVDVLALSPTVPPTLYAGTFFGGLFRSTDSGTTWITADAGVSGYATSLAIHPTNLAALYAGTFGGGVFRSTDSGATWVAANTGLTDLSIPALAINPSNPAVLYAGTQRSGVFKSIDAGGTWSAANSGLTDPEIRALAIDPLNPATLYASTRGGVFKSTDSGGQWAAVNAGLIDLNVGALAVNPVNPATLYVGSNSGVSRSTDAGGSWAAANIGFTDLEVGPLAINPTNPATLYAGTARGVFRSTNSGGTWTAVSAGLPFVSISALALDPTGATTLYAGLFGGSVWQSTPPTRSTTVLLPTSAHAAGLDGAIYTSDVSVSNAGGYAVSVALDFLGNNRDGLTGPERTFNLDPGKSATLVDVLSSTFGQTSSFGAIRLTSNASSVDVVSVTSTPGFGGTFGQTIPAISFSDLIPAGAARSILYIREDGEFRTNLILASGSFVSTNVDAALISQTGETLAMKSYSVPPNGMTQVNRVVRDMGVSGAITGARLVLSSSTPGALFTGIVSVIDEATNDPTTMIAQPGSVTGSAPFTWLLPTSAHSSGLGGAFYTSSVSVANVDSAPASYTLKFLGNNQDGSGGVERTFNLESGKSVIYFDVLGSVFNLPSNFGAIRISSDSPFLNIASVISTPGFGGTLSQTVPAVFSSDLIPTGSSRSILYIREGDGFRSNLIFASAAAVSTTVDVSLVSADGSTLATKSYSVPPNGMTQINRIVRDMGVSGAITGARLVLSSSTPNTAFTGFASVIDETTNDPTTIEAK